MPAHFEDLRESDGQAAPQRRELRLRAGKLGGALGFGFRCGFLGLLHLEIMQERLSREFDLDLIATAPSVVYKVHLTDGTVIEMHNPADMPDAVRIDHIEEPRIKATILVPDEYLGAILKLCQDRRGIQQNLTYVGNRAMVVYDLPLNEVVFDFYDRLKSREPRLRELRLHDPRTTARTTSCKPVDPRQCRAGGRARHHRAPRGGRKPRAGRCARS